MLNQIGDKSHSYKMCGESTHLNMHMLIKYSYLCTTSSLVKHTGNKQHSCETCAENRINAESVENRLDRKSILYRIYLYTLEMKLT